MPSVIPLTGTLLADLRTDLTARFDGSRNEEIR